MDETKMTTEIDEELVENSEKSENFEENVSRETSSEKIREETADNGEEEPKNSILWSAEYRLTKEEQEAFAEHTGLFSTKTRTIAQGGLAAVLCVVNGISYATGGSKMALFLCIVCAVLCGACFVVPAITRKNVLASLKESAESGDPTRVQYDGEALIFGAQGEELRYACDKMTVRVYDDIATLLMSDGQMVCLPKRAVSDEAWEEICSRKQTAKKQK